MINLTEVSPAWKRPGRTSLQFRGPAVIAFVEQRSGSDNNFEWNDVLAGAGKYQGLAGEGQ